tara:strand:+ start:87 stop:404 length:318 start_codon:yes stop_codon:yes gene_type:complete
VLVVVEDLSCVVVFQQVVQEIHLQLVLLKEIMEEVVQEMEDLLVEAVEEALLLQEQQEVFPQQDQVEQVPQLQFQVHQHLILVAEVAVLMQVLTEELKLQEEMVV